ncbi:glycosyltransferase [Tundrisphaera lichenicola]|uniref:glycosyltransferase n=1 Tax=Tundrisphaera lichenicola TaxID=2029860 RepID=UPI003EC112EB
MGHIGVFCPNSPGHLNPMVALADATRARGHRVTFFLLGDPPSSVAAAGFEIISLGESVFPPDEYRAGLQRLGTLQGRAALTHTFSMGRRSAEATLEVGPTAVRSVGVTALLVDQASLSGGTVADQLGLPFATVCNALLLHSDPAAPPFFTHWQPRDTRWARLRNQIAWAGLNRMYAPILTLIQERRRQLGLPVPERITGTWSDRLQVSQQPELFEFPRRDLPKQVRFVGPLRLPGGYQPVSFPWERLDGRPLIYASLGTLQNRIGGTFRVIAEACEGLDVQLVISTGHGVTPEALGELPGRPVVVPYAPQLDLLARSTVAVTHAGLNTVLDALATGIPMVAVPVANEQPGIAARVAWVGAGEAIAHERLTAQTLRAAVVRVQTDQAYRAAAELIRDSIRAGGGAPRAAEMIEQGLVP